MNEAEVVVISDATTEDHLPVTGHFAKSAALEADSIAALIDAAVASYVTRVPRHDTRTWIEQSRKAIFRVARVGSWPGFYKKYNLRFVVQKDGDGYWLTELVPAPASKGLVAGHTQLLGTTLVPLDVAHRLLLSSTEK